MADEPHAVVRLLLARMESHPEEFSDDNGRWAQWLDELMPFVTEKERLMLRKPMMQTIHEEVMDELLNGPEKRRKEEEEREYERQVMQQALQRNNQMSVQQAMQQKMQQAMQQAIQLGGGGASLPVSTSPYQNALAQGIVGRSPTSILMDEYVDTGILPVANGGTGNTLTNTINQIKEMLGAKK